MIFYLIILRLVLICLLTLYVYKESTGYHVVNYTVLSDKLSKDKVSVVFLSDLHNKQYGELNINLYDDIVKINPDIIIFGGDMITSCMEKWSGYDDTLAFVEKLKAKYPVYYGMGNHEERLRRCKDKFSEGEYERLTGKLSEIGTPIIIDECIHLQDENIDLYGLDLEHAYYRKVITKPFPDDHLEKKLGKVDAAKFNVLIAHNPEHFRQYAAWGADLVLSGHVHGGIIRLPILGGVISPALKIFPKYDGGLFDEYGSKMILSRGIGTHTVPVRVNNKAEIIVIELTKK